MTLTFHLVQIQSLSSLRCLLGSPIGAPAPAPPPIPPPPLLLHRRHYWFLLLTLALLLLLLLVHAAAPAALRRANALGRRCSVAASAVAGGGAEGTAAARRRRRIAMVSFAAEEGNGGGGGGRRSFEGVMEAVEGNKRGYAARMGYDYVDARGAVDPRRPPSWSKILAVRSLLPSYDWVFWNDADTVITNPNISLVRACP
ncbi:hypothetical protein ACMD2_19052 [Ananas comosus]|uniref:Uncharacterized protein n=1 Tax=Ananas comosus TaxID=4615 RepID=A0A199VMN0_ANACO|nr:hypothetical protein ACMD2_19052 [Ananas comosus]